MTTEITNAEIEKNPIDTYTVFCGADCVVFLDDESLHSTTSINYIKTSDNGPVTGKMVAMDLSPNSEISIDTPYDARLEFENEYGRKMTIYLDNLKFDTCKYHVEMDTIFTEFEYTFTANSPRRVE